MFCADTSGGHVLKGEMCFPEIICCTESKAPKVPLVLAKHKGLDGCVQQIRKMTCITSVKMRLYQPMYPSR